MPGFSLNVVMNGWRVPRHRASAPNMNKFHLRPVDLRHDSGDDFALIWRADLGLTEPSIITSPVYALADREAVRGGWGRWV